MARVTLRDVADASGYSVATVSRVFAGSRPVNSEIARHIRELGESMGYRPDRVARALRSGSTGTFGVLVPQITNPFFPGLIHDVERAFKASGQALLFSDSDDDPAIESAGISMLLDRQVDGLIVIPCHTRDSRVAVMAAAEVVPVLLLDRRVDDANMDFIGVDNFAGLEAIVKHLEATGRRRFAFVGTDQSGSSTRERLTAYQEFSEHVHPGNSSHVYLGGLSVEWGYEAAGRMLAARALPEAVICANDLVAMGVVQALRHHGVQIPRDTAVCGFDDTVFARVCDPALTTCRQPTRAMAAEAVRLITSRMAHASVETVVNVRFAPELIVRGSSLDSRHGPPTLAPAPMPMTLNGGRN